MFTDLFLFGNAPFAFWPLLILFAPIISLVINFQLKELSIIIKSKGFFYVFAFLSAFVLARVLFLLWTEVIRFGINNFYSFTPQIINLIFFLSSISYWIFIGKFLKVKDRAAQLTIMYVAEIFWLVIVSMLACLILTKFII